MAGGSCPPINSLESNVYGDIPLSARAKWNKISFFVAKKTSCSPSRKMQAFLDKKNWVSVFALSRRFWPVHL